MSPSRDDFTKLNEDIQEALSAPVKADTGKTRYDLIPADSLEEIARVLTYGATKYTERNWEKGLKYGRVFAACMRHLWAWWRAEGPDTETGLSHLAHAGCCIMFLLAYELRGQYTLDDRPQTQEQSSGTD